MNTRRRVLIISGVFLSLLMQKVQATANHLEPIPPYDSLDFDGTIHGYRQAVFTSLIGRGWLPSLWMIERPSSSREYGVMVWCSGEHDPNDTHSREIKREQWVVEYVIPKEKIWRWKPVGGGEIPDVRPTENVERRRVPIAPDIRPTRNVERYHVPITKEFAEVVQEAWLNTLQLTRYAENDSQGMDGTTLEFCCGSLFGQTWSPKTGLPAMLADLGRMLRTLAQSDDKGRKPLLAEAESLARKIAKEAEAEQIKLFGKKVSRSW
jgi:hypothetical protein